jgi:enediyne biosynthesis protein E4
MRRDVIGILLANAVLAAAAGAQEPASFQVPPEDLGAITLEARREAQLATRGAFGVEIGFSFSDQRERSGIDFLHEAVDDARRHWKPAHYDHGNGLLAADVDGDGLTDIYFLSQVGGNRLYRNLGNGRFEDITERSGVALADRISVSGAFADVDNDGDPDLFVTTVRTGNVLLLNDGTGRFTDVTEASGLAYSGHSSSATFFDYDLDGRLDLFVTNVGVYTSDEQGRGGFWTALPDAFQGHRFPERTERSLLYRNLGEGRFEEVAESIGLVERGWNGDANAIDLDRDRYPEIYAVSMQGDDHWWRNVEGKRFVEETAKLFPKTPWGAMGVGFFDWNNDQRLDLLVTDMHSDMHGHDVHPLRDEKRKYDVPVPGSENNVLGNAFWEQQPDGSFVEISDRVGAENYWPWGFSVGDLNADGWQDVFIASSMSFPFRYGVNTVLLNDRGQTFRDAEFILGVEPRAGGRTHAPLFTVDCGGTDAGDQVCQLSGQTGKVTVLGAVGTRSSVIFDLDGDGDLDIVTSEFNDRPQVLISDLAQQREIRYLAIELTGTRSNRDGLGAWVTVHAGDQKWVRYHDGKSGYLSQSSLPLYFGLGGAKADRIEILWPSGTEQVVTTAIPTAGVMEIVEEEPPPR